MNLNINYQAMEEILRQPEDIINLFTVNIQDECNNLSDLNYYQEGQADEIFDMYPTILDKIQEVGDMYYTTYRLAAHITQEMQALDMLMAAMIQTGIAGFAGVAVKGDQEK